MADSTYIYSRGKRLGVAEHQLAYSRAFRFGDALFETIRVSQGKICFLQEHLTRLTHGMKVLKMQMHPDLRPASIREKIRHILNTHEMTGGARVRLTVYRGGEGFYTPEQNGVEYTIEITELPDSEFLWENTGKTIDLYEVHKKPIHELSTIKSTNSIFYIMAGIHASEKGWDDCLLVNDLGHIVESVSSNIFVAYNGVLYTPSTEQGCIPGIMRQQIIDIARSNHIEVQECPLSPQVLVRADEVFLTNAVEGIRWVLAYRSKRYFNKVGKKLMDKLNETVANSTMDPQGN